VSTTQENGVSQQALLESIAAVEAYVVNADYRGYDPFDALTSPLFRLRPFRTSRILRLAVQQAVRRSPVNVRPLLRIRKGYNPVTLALVLEASTYLANVQPDRADVYRERAEHCVRELRAMRSAGYSGDCWGYDFDWEGRNATIPASTPTVVATGQIGRASCRERV